MVVVSTAKVVHHVDRHGDGSRSAHTQDEMDIYVNDGYLVVIAGQVRYAVGG